MKGQLMLFTRQSVKILGLCVCFLILTDNLHAQTWSSALFPKDANGEFSSVPVSINGYTFSLPDFSNAGYQRGRKEIPTYPGNTVLQPDLDDISDTARIQAALDSMPVGEALILDTGEYEIETTLYIPPYKVLRGRGPGLTKIKVNKTNTQGFTAIELGTQTTQHTLKYYDGSVYYATADIPKGSTSIFISAGDLANLNVGDIVVIKNEIRNPTAAYDAIRLEYNGVTQINGQVIWPYDNASFKNIRKIIAKDATSITVDTPISHLMQMAHGACAMKITFMQEEMGVEDFSISFIPVANWSSYENGDATSPIHNSTAIRANAVMNAWIKNIHSYAILVSGLNPDINGYTMHLHSKGIIVSNSRLVTVEDCVMDRPAHRGGWGNGYLFLLEGTDCLIKNCVARNARHSYILAGGAASGNVISGCEDIDDKLNSDSHFSLATQNLIENIHHSLPSGLYHWFSAFSYVNRNDWSAGAGYCAADIVCWGLRIDDTAGGVNVQIETPDVNGSKGYAIGCSDADFTTTTANEYREGILDVNRMPDNLEPASLWKAQFDIKTKIFCSFDTTSSLVATDLMGTDDGTLGSGSAIGAGYGVHGTKGIRFNGTTDRKIAFTPNTNTVMGTGDYSLAAWIKFDSYTSPIIFRHGSGLVDYYYLSLTADYKLRFILRETGVNPLTVFGNTPIPLNKWVHVAVTCDRKGNATLFLNGKVDGIADISSYAGFDVSAVGDHAEGQKVDFGTYLGYGFHGYGDNILIANYAMSQREITKLAATSHYSFDNTTASDSMGVANGTLTNGTAPDFRFMNFDGIDDYVFLGSDQHDINQDDFSISVWAKYQAGGGGRILMHGSGQSDYYYFIVTSTGTLKFFAFDKDLNVFKDGLGTKLFINLESTNTVPVNQWVHLAVSLDRQGQGRLYINGVEEDAANISALSGVDIVSLQPQIQRYTSISYPVTDSFSGSLDEIRIYKNIALDAAQIKALSAGRD